MENLKPKAPRNPDQDLFRIRQSKFDRYTQKLAAKRAGFRSWNAWASSRLKEAADRDLRESGSD